MTWWQRLSWLLLLAVALALPTSAQMNVTIEGVPGGGPGITDGDKGDISVTASGTVWTIDPGTVTYAKLQPATAASRLLGRSSAGAGDWQEVTLGTNLSMSGTTLNAAGGAGVTDGDKGDITVLGAGTTWVLDLDTVTYAKLQNTTAASILLGRGSAVGAGDPQEITLGANLSMSGTTLNAAGAAGVPDGDKGDVTVSSSGTVWTIDPGVVTYAKMQEVSATGRLLGRVTAGAGPIEELPATTAKALLSLEQVTNRSDADMFVLAKKFENTRLKKRILNQENISPITIDTNTTDVVKIAELSQDTTFNPPTGTPDPEDALIIEICTTARRTLTFSTATNGFSVGLGLTLPSTNDPGTCNEHLFKWKATNKWAFVSSTQTTTRGVAAQVWTSGGPLAEPGWAASTGGAGVGERFLPVTAVGFPATGAARVEFSGNSHKLLYDNSTRWCAFWGPFMMNPDYASVPILKITYSTQSPLTLGIAMDVRVMAITPGVDTGATANPDTDTNYGAVNTCTDSAVPAAANVPETLSCSLTLDDGLAARDLTKVELCRNVSHATDQAAGLIQVLAVSLEFTK